MLTPEFGPAGGRKHLEEAWQKRVRQAQTAYRLAVAEHTKILEEHTSGKAAGSDLSLALGQARQAESNALSEYMRVLRVFTDMLLYSKIPEDDPEESSKLPGASSGGVV